MSMDKLQEGYFASMQRKFCGICLLHCGDVDAKISLCTVLQYDFGNMAGIMPEAARKVTGYNAERRNLELNHEQEDPG